MGLSGTQRRLATVIGVFLAVALILSGVWILRHDSTGTTPHPPAGATAPTPTGTTPSSAARTMTVKVYFHRGSPAEPGKVVSVKRVAPLSFKVATAALTQLLAGPTRAERQAGYWSFFSAETAGDLRSVQVKNAVGYADFRDYRSAMPSATSSAGSAALLAELDATFRQFGNVGKTVYSFNGDVPAFYEWLQLDPPVGQGPVLAEAERVARAFLTDVVGMRTVRIQGSRWRSDFIATVDARAGSGQGPVSTVTLGKGNTSFSVLAVTTDTIVVEYSARDGRVSKTTAVRVAFVRQPA